MKKLFFLLFTLLVFTSCSKSPENIAKRFMENLWHGKLEEAKKDATEATAKSIESGSFPIDPDYKFKLIKCRVDGNHAYISYENPRSNKQKAVIELVKVDGVWKVHVPE